MMLLVSYLIGSLPFGLLITRAMALGDIRKVSSGNIGAANAMRMGGLRVGLIVVILDMLKGFVAAYLGWRLDGATFGALCGLFAIIGHCFPVWLKFKGGKGVGPLFGVFLAINPLIFVACGISYLIVALSLRYSSAGSLTASVVAAILGFAISINVGLIMIATAVIIFCLHHENIKRLINGNESKLEWKWKK